MELVLQTKKDFIESMFVNIYQNSWIEGTREYKKRNINTRVFYIERFDYEHIMQKYKFNLYEKYYKGFNHIQKQFYKYIIFYISDFNTNILCWE